MVVTLLPVFLAAALIVAALTPAVRAAAHRVPLARLGGVGIGVAWIAVLVAAGTAGPDALRLPLRQMPLPEIVAAGFIVFALGVLHDLRMVSPARKILVTGFVLSVTAITGLQKSATALAVGGMILVFALPIEDILSILVRRHADRERQRGVRRT